MKRRLFITFLVLYVTGACSIEDSEYQRLSGTYTEISPIEGRTQLTFLPGKRVVKTEVEDNYSDTFFYEIAGEKIKLTPVWNSSIPSELTFEFISESELKIENLYVSIPENPPVTMTFKK